MKQNEIWLIDLDPTKGSEIRKTRPAVIVNDNALGRLPLRIIVPITDWNERYSQAIWMTKLSPTPMNGLSKDSAADCFQIRSVSETRFIRKLGQVDGLSMESIREALSKLLTIE